MSRAAVDAGSSSSSSDKREHKVGFARGRKRLAEWVSKLALGNVGIHIWQGRHQFHGVSELRCLHQVPCYRLRLRTFQVAQRLQLRECIAEAVERDGRAFFAMGESV